MKHLLVLLCISSVLFVSCKKKDAATTDTAVKVDSTKEKAIENYKAVAAMFASGKTDDLGKYVDSNMVDHTPDPGAKQGLAGLKEMIAGMRAGFPDLKMTVKDITADNGLIWAHVNMAGTNTGPMMGMPPTGKKMDINGVDIIKITNGKATDHWGYYQERLMMEQMGMMPPHPDKGAPAAPPAKKGK